MNTYAEAAAIAWGYVLLVAMVVSLAHALLWWAARAVRWCRVRRARRRFTEEAIEQALDELGREWRAGRVVLPGRWPSEALVHHRRTDRPRTSATR